MLFVLYRLPACSGALSYGCFGGQLPEAQPPRRPVCGAARLSLGPPCGRQVGRGANTSTTTCQRPYARLTQPHRAPHLKPIHKPIFQQLPPILHTKFLRFLKIRRARHLKRSHSHFLTHFYTLHTLFI